MCRHIKIENDAKAANVTMGIKILNMVDLDQNIVNTILDEYNSLRWEFFLSCDKSIRLSDGLFVIVWM